MPDNPQIHAIGDVRLEAPPHREHGLRAFYGDLLGLREPDERPEASQMAFEAHGLRLLIGVFADALPSPMRRRLLVQVDSLEDLAEQMRRRGVACRVYAGMGIGDRRLVALDPAGNRVEFKEVRPL